ncbi:MAG TPA: DNA-processing protein DprA [Candidatus Ozemobacteraceae bacterium]
MSEPLMDRADPRTGWLRLASAVWIGDTVRAGLIRELGTPEAVFRADRVALSRVKGWSRDRLERFLAERDRLCPVCDPTRLDRAGVRLVTFRDPEYPALLREIPDSPLVLFVRGRLPVDPRPHIAIVGARNGTQLGFDIARDFGRELAAAGFVVVSGLALGIDTFAHLGALEGHGTTVAVLGSGPDIAYPAANRKIRERMLAEGGALVSEYPPGTPARPWHFPVRNRVIAGMCVATVVIEASARSGSLITARLAAEQDREVFAVPGNIRSALAEGTLALIKDGAQLVTAAQDLIEYYARLLPARPVEDSGHAASGEIPDLTDEEARLLGALAADPVPLDRLLADGRWTRDRLFSLLLTLEMRDFLVKLPGNRYHAKIKPPQGRHQ